MGQVRGALRRGAPGMPPAQAAMAQAGRLIDMRTKIAIGLLLLGVAFLGARAELEIIRNQFAD